MNRLIFTACLVVMPFFLFSQDVTSDQANSIKQLVAKLEEALKKKKFEILKDLLDEEFNYSGMNQPMSGMVMQQVVGGYPLTLSSIAIKEISKHSAGYRVKVTLQSTTEVEDHILEISSDMKFLKAEVVKIQLANPHGHGMVTPSHTTPGETLPDQCILPIQFENNLSLVQASVNGKTNRFILDTGAPTLILNSDVFQSLAYHGEVQSMGATGAATLRRTEIESFEMYGINISNMPVMSTSLDHLKVKSSGLLGVDVFSEYLMVFDYGNKQISLHRSKVDHSNNLLNDFNELPTSKLAHLPVIEAYVNHIKLRLIVDSGAGDFVINKKSKQKVLGFVKLSNQKATVKGVGKESYRAEKGKLKQLTVGGKNFRNVPVIFDDLMYDHGHEVVDGIIGHALLSRGVFAYDVSKGKFYMKK